MTRIYAPAPDNVTEQLKPGGICRVDIASSIGELPSMTDAPFHCPPDIILDLPVPPSVNRTRRIDWSAVRTMKAWSNVADAYVLAAKGRTNSPLKLVRVPRFEITVTLDEKQTRIDLDNGLKCLIDYLRRIQLIEDDSPKHMRRLVVQWGMAPFGCRVTIRPLASGNGVAG